MKKQENQKKRAVFLAVVVLMSICMGGNTAAKEREAQAARNFAIESSGKDTFISNDDFVLVLTAEHPILNADDKSSTEITVEIYDYSTHEICENADGIEIKFSTTLGRMDADTVIMHNGKAVNIFYSQDLLDTPQYATITAEIIASYKFPELNGYKGIMSVALFRGDRDIIKKTQKITYSASIIKKGKVVYGSSFFLNAKTTGTGELTYNSSNNKVFSVDSKGKVTVKGYGPAYIKIKAAGDNGYKAVVRKLKLIAVPKQGKVTKAEWQKSGVYFKWKTDKMADGYEYAFAYNKKFSGQSRKKTSKTGLILTKYKTGTKKMYFKVRTYKKVRKKTYYGSWSKMRLLKLKKVRKARESSYTIVD